jgi:MFS superfamily sulfate permease-like transporter
MKKLCVFFCLMFFAGMSLFAQDPTAPPAGWGEILANPMLWFGSFAGVSLLTTFLATFFNAWLKITKNFPRQLCAWVVAILIMVATDLLNYGYAAEFPIWLAIAHGFAAGLASNGWFDIPLLKSILDKVEGWFIKPEPAPPVE